jgi:hypothetical protein
MNEGMKILKQEKGYHNKPLLVAIHQGKGARKRSKESSGPDAKKQKLEPVESEVKDIRDIVTPLWKWVSLILISHCRIPYEDQLKMKIESTEKVLKKFAETIRNDSISQVPEWIGNDE